MSKTIIKRQERDKELLLEKLKSTPIVQVACQKAGIGRASYYRWRREDKEFASAAGLALAEGRAFVNDMAESQLLRAIKDENMTAIIFWLRSHHPSYAPKLELEAKLKVEKEILTPEQEALITNALRLAGLLTKNKREKEQK